MDENFEETLGVKAIEIQKALEELKASEIKVKVSELKSKLPYMGRCPICTLRLPCKHYNSISEVPKQSEGESITPLTKNGFKVTDYLPKLTPESNKRGFNVRYQGKTAYYDFDIIRRHTSLPNEKRLKHLETIESYREEKLKKEIQKIHKIKDEEKQEKLKAKLAEKQRKNYLDKQKEKLKDYQETLPLRKEKILELLKAENFKKQKDENLRKKYLDKQKARLFEYYEQKNMMKNISNQKVQDLEEFVTNHKPIKLKSALE